MPLKILGPKGHVVVRSLTPAALAKRVPALVKRFGEVTVTAATSTAPRPVPTTRQRIVEFWRWGITNAAKIGYAEVRPIPKVIPGKLPKLPFTTDCSGDVTMGYQYAGARNPNRADGVYDGQGYTGTLLKVGKHIPIANVKPGDVAVFGCKTYPNGHHAAGVTDVRSKTLAGIVLSSHGSAVGPLEITAADEAKYQPDGPAGIVFLSFLP